MEKLAAGRSCSRRAGTGRRTRKDPVDVDDEVPDDSLVDHTADRFESD